MNAIRFDGRVAIVTGAGGGLGRSHAMMLASRGARVLVNDLGTSIDGRGQPSQAAEAVAAEIRAGGGVAVANGDDISSAAGAARLADQALDAFGRIDILVNNAGILRDKTFAKMELVDFEKVLGVHLLGAVYCTKTVWDRMTEQGYGRVIVTTSSSGLYGHFGQTNYDAAKLGLVGFIKGLAQEGRRYGVLANAVAPLAATRMSDGVLNAEAFKRMPPEHVSAVVAYLASDRNAAERCSWLAAGIWPALPSSSPQVWSCPPKIRRPKRSRGLSRRRRILRTPSRTPTSPPPSTPPRRDFEAAR